MEFRLKIDSGGAFAVTFGTLVVDPSASYDTWIMGDDWPPGSHIQ